MNGRGVKSKRYEDLGLKNRWKFRLSATFTANLGGLIRRFTPGRIHEGETGPLPKADRGRDGPKATPPSEPDGRFSRIRLSG